MSKDRGRANGISSWCKKCRAVSVREWVRNNPEKRKVLKDLERLKIDRSRVLNPGKEWIKQRGYVLKCRYGITLKDYDDLLKKQNFKCAICHKDSQEMTYLLHVDHCHSSNKVRGLLCAKCNQFLGCIKDSVEALHRGIEYISSSAKNATAK